MNQTGIIRCLARVGSTGWLGIFGSIHPLALSIGDLIVVGTELGEFPAEVVAIFLASFTEASAKNNYYAGELLRKVSESERPSILSNRNWCRDQLPRIEELVSQHTGTLNILDCERTFCGQHLVIWFLGMGTAELGPQSVHLAEQWKLGSVRFISPDSVRSLTEKKLPLHDISQSPATWQHVALEKENAEKRFSKESAALLQQHGVYQQKIRRSATVHPHQGSSSTTAMIRIRRQGAYWTCAQMAKLLRWAAEFGDGWLRPTSRQGWQIYGVSKEKIAPLQKCLDSALLTSHGACGNHPRNITCCPLSFHGNTTERYAHALALELERLLIPKCPSYEWIWFGETSAEHLQEIQDSTLPHKFKLGIATYEHVCNEVLCNDLAIILQPHDVNPAELVAAVYVGGSLAFRLEHSETFPQLARYACTLRVDEILPFTRGLILAFQKYGPRLQRRRSRLKYWLEAIGMDELLRLTILEASRPIQPVVLAATPDIPPTAKHRGIHSYHEATFVGLKWKAWGLYGGDEQLQHSLQNVDFPWLKQWYLTTHQEVLFGPLSQISSAEISAGIEQSGIARYILEPSLHDIRDGLQDSENFLPQVMSCAALPTCSLAVSDAEGHKAELVSWLAEFQSISGLARGEIDCRISGCTNNCSRPLLSDIGIIAHGPNRYGVYVGGNHAEQKLARYTGQEFPWGPALKAYLHELVVRQLGETL